MIRARHSRARPQSRIPLWPFRLLHSQNPWDAGTGSQRTALSTNEKRPAAKLRWRD